MPLSTHEPIAATPYTVVESTSAVSWAVIFAGAAAAAAFSLVLLSLGTGLGFAAISPWHHQGMGAGALGISAIVWLALTQIIASVIGGYLAGRLGASGATLDHTEARFRNIAHGLLTWAVASLLVVAVAGNGLGSAADKGIDASKSLIAGVAGGTASFTEDGAQSGGLAPVDYYARALFRAPGSVVVNSSAQPLTPGVLQEVVGILVNAVKMGALPEDDRNYLGTLVSRHTGLNQAEASARVDNLYKQASQAFSQVKTEVGSVADSARKSVAYSALGVVVALLCGALAASIAALLGGSKGEALHRHLSVGQLHG